MRGLDAIFHIFFSWIPGMASRCTGLGLAHELLLLCFAPLMPVLVIFGLAAVRRKPLVTALPFALVITFLCFPFVASRGFRALAPCDCFNYVNGSKVCFLHGAYSVPCDLTPSGGHRPPVDILVGAWLAVMLYAVAMPLVYAALLFTARQALSGTVPPTALSRALHFLTRDYEPRVFWWEMVEVARKLTVTGFVALIEPGTLLQLYLGVAVALCILILQLYAAPYRSPGDDFLSMVSAAALVLTLLGSLGIQMINLEPDMKSLGRVYTGLGPSSLFMIAGVLIVTALLVLLVALAMFIRGVREVGVLPIARWAADSTIAVPRVVPKGAYHAFISHQWGGYQSLPESLPSACATPWPHHVLASPHTTCWQVVGRIRPAV